MPLFTGWGDICPPLLPSGEAESRLTKWLNVAHYSLEIPAPGFVALGRPPPTQVTQQLLLRRLYLSVTWVNTLASLTSKPFCFDMSSSCGVFSQCVFTISPCLPGNYLFKKIIFQKSSFSFLLILESEYVMLCFFVFFHYFMWHFL